MHANGSLKYCDTCSDQKGTAGKNMKRLENNWVWEVKKKQAWYEIKIQQEKWKEHN